ncbi:hypothetical protein NVV95_15260 [Herbiconiux sp. CPCC 205716]|uniref:TPM domain-containing protein n=1 Tax=Herbiconiux gentiana TaxID=2970912 RepID=A0ABT2GKS8_9MICO|nr:hypothetical protein [Herbiconiux gentiana]MCS5715905.1 hypothetical protein [Herbiconiux gentiana]
MDGFDLLPSAIILGAVLVTLAAASTVLRRRGTRQKATAAQRRTVAPTRLPVDELVKRANIQLVQMDDAIRDAADELEFARAEFDDAIVHEFAEALDTAKARASEAFALKQRLDDSFPDTEQEQRDWSKRILSLSDSALALVAAQTRAVGERRRAETAAPDALARLRDGIDDARERLPLASATLDELRDAYDPAALSAVDDADSLARDALDAAAAATRQAEQDLQTAAVAPVAKDVQRAEQLLREAVTRLDSVDRTRDALRRARADRASALAQAAIRLADAEALRATVADADAAQHILDAEKRVRDTVALAETRRPAHPTADIDALNAAATELDHALHTARTAQQRLDSARDALAGALAIAESHISAASELISSRRSGVGTDARTRLAAAERELQLARLEADPVAALDGARRSATLATDADALARYDTMHAR